MHELSIAQSLIKAVLREMNERRIEKVTKIAVRIGPWSGIMPDALVFGFETIRSGTPLAETILNIEEAPASAECQTCGHAFSLHEPTFTCPQCSSNTIAVTGGDDLHIAYLEVERLNE